MTKICGQCYDRASNMQGIRNGVAKLIQDEEPRGVFTHCYGHSLSLAAKDTIQGYKNLKKFTGNNTQNYKLGQVFPQKRKYFQWNQGRNEGRNGGLSWFSEFCVLQGGQWEQMPWRV